MISIKEEKTCSLDTTIFFLKTSFQNNLAGQHLLYELYMHEYILFGEMKFNLSNYVGDIQLRDFTRPINCYGLEGNLPLYHHNQGTQSVLECK